MSRAENRYLEHFQDGRLKNCSSKESFLLGYHQAEKDNKLTWEDINDIIRIYEDVIETESGENIYIKVLKRFKEIKY